MDQSLSRKASKGRKQKRKTALVRKDVTESSTSAATTAAGNPENDEKVAEAVAEPAKKKSRVAGSNKVGSDSVIRRVLRSNN